MPVEEVPTPGLFPASRLALGVSCPLALALSCAPDVSPLPAHPRAWYGRLFHLLLERAVRGEVEAQPSPRAGARTAFDGLASKARRGELPGFPDDLPSPEAVYGPLEWRRKVGDVVALAGALSREGGRPRQLYHDPALVRTHRPLLDGDGRWTELPLKSTRLRVHGRADLVEREGGEVQIVDLKTGRAVAADGEVFPEVAFQLRAYGLVVEEQLPSASVRLIVEGHRTVDVPFGEGARDATLETLRDLSDQLPPGRTIRADATARPGPACRRCSRRHRCRSYLSAAPSWWREGASHPFPEDVWGTVRAVVHDSGGTLTLDLEDAAGRYVRLHGVRPEFVAGVRVGCALFAFGLDAERSPRPGGVRRAPANYRDVNPDMSSEAWSLATYLGDAREADGYGIGTPASSQVQ